MRAVYRAFHHKAPLSSSHSSYPVIVRYCFFQTSTAMPLVLIPEKYTRVIIIAITTNPWRSIQSMAFHVCHNLTVVQVLVLQRAIPTAQAVVELEQTNQYYMTYTSTIVFLNYKR
uniref:Uncharacterized protein n=1 Tax=Lygus hesperus TaxID=30085 RepID=A0A146M8Y1_LYGHE